MLDYVKDKVEQENKLHPEKKAKYFELAGNTRGINNNVRIALLELESKDATGNTASNFQKELVKYTSNQYEFRTRVKAMEALERLNYCDEKLISHLFNACLYSNSRLANPASRVLKSLLKKDSNLEMAKGIFAVSAWKNWQQKIIEAQLKQ